jgi:hypothetical protein
MSPVEQQNLVVTSADRRMASTVHELDKRIHAHETEHFVSASCRTKKHYNCFSRKCVCSCHGSGH